MPTHQLIDQFSRTISYLRLSVTDRCNLRCMYCLPDTEDDKGFHLKTPDLLSRSQLLSFEELLRFVSIAVSMGMTKVRLTGGEPLVRHDIIGFIRCLVKIEGLEQVRLTTNGVLLQENAESLFRSGIRNLNISLDTLQPKKFARITGKDLFFKVWRGIEIARDMGFKIKLNVVAMKGINDDEFLDFARLSVTEPIQVRFIEFMPVGTNSLWNRKYFFATSNILEMISKFYKLEIENGMKTEGPARVFGIVDTKTGHYGKIGFISPISHHFCDTCNRLRLTSEGRLRACLLSDQEMDIRKMLRMRCSDDDLRRAIRCTIEKKHKGHSLRSDSSGLVQPPCNGRMSRIGG